MRATWPVLLLLALPLAGSVVAPLAAPDAPLQATAALASPASASLPPSPPPPRSRPLPECAIQLAAVARDGHVALSWAPCEGVESYQVLRGPSAAELVPLVEVDHPSHVDFPPEGGAVYAVRALGGALSAASDLLGG